VLLAVTVVVWLGRTGGPTVALPSPSGGVLVPASQHSVDRRELVDASGVALTVMGALSLGLGWLVAGRFLGPLRTITTAAREISATTLHERLNLSGPDDELTELADTFDELLDRLERSFASERRFVANASHELRTPLAGMRTSLDVAMAKPGPVPAHVVTLAERLRRELDRMDALLESFLALAKTQQGPLADQATLSLAELACVAIEDRAAAISAQGLNVEQRPDPHARVSGSAPLLARMVENVIENAIGHNQPDGWLRVCTAVEETRAQLVVENGGERLDPDDVKELSRPFRRAGAERTGSDRGAGLGLAIVASIAEVHGGTLNLAARSEGGLRVAIGLPLAAGATT
jgi:signal transduction histidine kinase